LDQSQAREDFLNKSIKRAKQLLGTDEGQVEAATWNSHHTKRARMPQGVGVAGLS